MPIHTTFTALISAGILATIILPAAAGPPGDLDGATGRIFDVDLDARTFELLKETEYDPVTLAGRSRFTVHWNEKTTITLANEVDDFFGIPSPVLANFYGIDDANHRAIERGEAFVARVAVIHDNATSIEDIEGEKIGVFGWFTPGDEIRSGTLRIGERDIPVSLRPRNWRIFYRGSLEPEKLVGTFWSTTIHGTHDEAGRFIISTMEVTPAPDPRETDVPSLPRVLTIGDSISMNYHDSAKAALGGFANYHRIEGNGSSSAHGVANAELWLGNYQEEGMHWDVIQFNHGLHDIRRPYDAESETWGPHAVPIKEYQENLERIIATLRETGATLIWAATTPVQRDILGRFARRHGDAAKFNQAALDVMHRHPDILITDLHGMITGSDTFDAWRETTDVHFYRPQEQQALGQAVAETIRAAIQQR